MELKAYLRVLGEKWRIVLLTFLVTYVATLAWTYQQPPVYEARATYVVKLSDLFGNDKDLADAVDILSRRAEIATTYTIVANSRRIKQLAAEQLGLTARQRSDITIASDLVPGTNVLEITAQAHDPVLAANFTNALGAKTIAYAQNLYESYRLEPLDQATAPSTPITPNKPLNLGLGAAMGLVLGAAVAFLSAYLQAPVEQAPNFGVLDDDTGVHNKRYFTLRLRQELSRSKRTQLPLALALVNVDHGGVLGGASPQVRREALRKVVALLRPHLREEDIVAYFGTTVFALLLPDTANDGARATIEQLQRAISQTPVTLERSGLSLDLHGSAGAVVFPDPNLGENVSADDLIQHAEHLLQQAETTTYGDVCLLLEDTQRAGAAVRTVAGVGGAQ